MGANPVFGERPRSNQNLPPLSGESSSFQTPKAPAIFMGPGRPKERSHREHGPMRFYKVQAILALLVLLKFWGRRKIARYIGRRPFENQRGVGTHSTPLLVNTGGFHRRVFYNPKS